MIQSNFAKPTRKITTAKSTILIFDELLLSMTRSLVSRMKQSTSVFLNTKYIFMHRRALFI